MLLRKLSDWVGLSRPVTEQPIDYLDRPFLQLDGENFLSIRDSITGIIITGSTGSGKTSGPFLNSIAAAMSLGAGMVIYAVKGNEEVDTYLKLVRKIGRSSVVVHDPLREPANYIESARKRLRGDPAAVEILTKMIASPVNHLSSTSSGDGRHWASHGERLIGSVVALACASDTPLSFRLIQSCLTSAAKSAEESRDPEWQRTDPICKMILQSQERDLSPDEQQAVDDAGDLWLNELPSASHKLRDSYFSMISGPINQLVRGTHGRFLNADSAAVDHDFVLKHNGILIYNCPVQQVGSIGHTLAKIHKQDFAMAAFRRRVSTNTKPVYICQDEFQHLVDVSDSGTGTVAEIEVRTQLRSRRVSVICATQTVPGMTLACKATKHSEQAALAILNSMGCKCWTSNTCYSTTDWFNKTIASVPSFRPSFGTSDGTKGKADKSKSSSINMTRELRSEFERFELQRLRTGGPPDYQVDAIVCVAGQRFASGKNAAKVAFRQVIL